MPTFSHDVFEDFLLELETTIAETEILLEALDREEQRAQSSAATTSSETTQVRGGAPKQDTRPASKANPLDYNATDGTSDPEQKDGVLPFTDAGWRADEILSNLTQVDNDPLTITDHYRCAAVSVLAVHVQGGPSSISKVASSTTQKMKKDIADIPVILQRRLTGQDANTMAKVELYNITLTNLRALLPVIQGIPGRVSGKMATYQDLRRLSHAMKIVVDPNKNSGTSSLEYDELVDIGDAADPTSEPLKGYVGKEFKGFSKLEQLVTTMQAASTYPFSFVLSINMTSDASNGTNHAVNLGKNASGKIYLFDPWPRQGSQTMLWDSSRNDIKDYVVAPSGADKSWKVQELINSA